MTTTKNIKITLSDRRPVSIDPEKWPIAASVSDHDGQVKCQANTIWYIKVRENEDGRRVVYGAKDAGDGGQHMGFRGTYGGFLIDKLESGQNEEETIRAIRRVAGMIERDDLGAECIGDLPATELT